jgi:hypothetical protein
MILVTHLFVGIPEWDSTKETFSRAQSINQFEIQYS